jgi:hypothetical protein
MEIEVSGVRFRVSARIRALENTSMFKREDTGKQQRKKIILNTGFG